MDNASKITKIKSFMLIFAVLLLLHPLLLLLGNGNIIAKPCCEPGTTSIIFTEFGPVSLLVGLTLLITYFILPIKKLNKPKDYLFTFWPFILPLLILGYLIFSTIQSRQEVAKYQACSPIVWKETGGFVDVDKQIDCFKQNGIKYSVLENDLKNFKEAQPEYSYTDYFPYIN